MSLGLFALRAITRKSLLGRTLAGAAVSCSSIVPLDEFLSKREGDTHPYVLVFTDKFSTREGGIEGRDLLGAPIIVTLALELAVATKPPTVSSEEEDGEDIVIPQTDEGFELTLDLLQRQVETTLIASNGSWPELWRNLVVRFTGYSAERGAAAERGVRYAARRIELDLELIDDPTPGAPASGLWAEILTAFEADSELSGLAPLLRREVEGGALVEWRRHQAELGLTLRGVRGIGIAPMFETAEEAAPAATVGIVDDDDRGEELVVTAEEADE